MGQIVYLALQAKDYCHCILCNINLSFRLDSHKFWCNAQTLGIQLKRTRLFAPFEPQGIFLDDGTLCTKVSNLQANEKLHKLHVTLLQVIRACTSPLRKISVQRSPSISFMGLFLFHYLLSTVLHMINTINYQYQHINSL